MRSCLPLMLAVLFASGAGCRRDDGGKGPPLETGYRVVEAGLDRVSWCGSPAKDHLLESTGSGLAFCDLDGDGRDDILVLDAWKLADREEGAPERRVLSRGAFAFYRNLGQGRFEETAGPAGLQGGGAWGTTVCVGDIDADGKMDIYVGCFGRNLLFHNLGGGRFEECAASRGVDDGSWAGGCAFFDADRDGDLDLYLSNYVETTEHDLLAARRTLVYAGKIDVMMGPFGLVGAADRYFENDGSGHFHDATEKAGLVDRALGFGLGVIATDLDDDGDVDLYVANDSNPNYLYRNDGKGHFEEIGVISGAAFGGDGSAQAGMGVEVLDADGDGILDLFVTNFSQDQSTLYLGEGDLFYRDASKPSRIALATFAPLSWGTLAVDLDEDGHQDLVVANGHIYPQVENLGDGTSYRQKNLGLLNDGNGVFRDGSTEIGPGFAEPGSFRGAAWGDIDQDGDVDLVFSRIDEKPLLLRKVGGRPRRRLDVVPDPSPLPAWMGARIEVWCGSRRQSRVILSGGSYASQSALHASFALGDIGVADRVTVRLADGRKLEFRDVEAGTTLRIPLRP